jgi:hypothetical protein
MFTRRTFFPAAAASVSNRFHHRQPAIAWQKKMDFVLVRGVKTWA